MSDARKASIFGGWGREEWDVRREQGGNLWRRGEEGVGCEARARRQDLAGGVGRGGMADARKASV